MEEERKQKKDKHLESVLHIFTAVYISAMKTDRNHYYWGNRPFPCKTAVKIHAIVGQRFSDGHVSPINIENARHENKF